MKGCSSTHHPSSSSTALNPLLTSLLAGEPGGLATSTSSTSASTLALSSSPQASVSRREVLERRSEGWWAAWCSSQHSSC